MSTCEHRCGCQYQHFSGEVIEGKHFTERSNKSQNEGTANKVYTPKRVTGLSSYQVSKSEKTDTIQIHTGYKLLKNANRTTFFPRDRNLTQTLQAEEVMQTNARTPRYREVIQRKRGSEDGNPEYSMAAKYIFQKQETHLKGKVC